MLEALIRHIHHQPSNLVSGQPISVLLAYASRTLTHTRNKLDMNLLAGFSYNLSRDSEVFGLSP